MRLRGFVLTDGIAVWGNIMNLGIEQLLEFRVQYMGAKPLEREMFVRYVSESELSENDNWVLVPFSMRFIPLIVYLLKKGMRVISDESAVNGKIDFFRATQEKMPPYMRLALLKNVDVCRVQSDGRWSTQGFRPEPFGLAWKEGKTPLRKLGWVSCESVETIYLEYELRYSQVDSEEVWLSSDMFMFEHDDAEYSVLRSSAVGADVELQVPNLFVSALEIFVRRQGNLPTFGVDGFGDSDFWGDFRLSQIRVAEALARGECGEARLIAADFFGISKPEISEMDGVSR